MNKEEDSKTKKKKGFSEFTERTKMVHIPMRIIFNKKRDVLNIGNALAWSYRRLGDKVETDSAFSAHYSFFHDSLRFTIGRRRRWERRVTVSL